MLVHGPVERRRACERLQAPFHVFDPRHVVLRSRWFHPGGFDLRARQNRAIHRARREEGDVTPPTHALTDAAELEDADPVPQLRAVQRGFQPHGTCTDDGDRLGRQASSGRARTYDSGADS